MPGLIILKKKRKRTLELFKTAGQDIMRDLLPVLTTSIGLQKYLSKNNNTENYTKRHKKLIQEKFIKTLQNKGVKSVGKHRKNLM